MLLGAATAQRRGLRLWQPHELGKACVRLTALAAVARLLQLTLPLPGTALGGSRLWQAGAAVIDSVGAEVSLCMYLPYGSQTVHRGVRARSSAQPE